MRILYIALMYALCVALAPRIVTVAVTATLLLCLWMGFARRCRYAAWGVFGFLWGLLR